jgi:glutathione S-transferase
MFSIFRAGTDEEKQQRADEWIVTVKKEIEPFLADAGPFFGGSKKLTLAEVCDRVGILFRIVLC